MYDHVIQHILYELHSNNMYIFMCIVCTYVIYGSNTLKSLCDTESTCNAFHMHFIDKIHSLYKSLHIHNNYVLCKSYAHYYLQAVQAAGQHYNALTLFSTYYKNMLRYKIYIHTYV